MRDGVGLDKFCLTGDLEDGLIFELGLFEWSIVDDDIESNGFLYRWYGGSSRPGLLERKDVRCSTSDDFEMLELNGFLCNC